MGIREFIGVVWKMIKKFEIEGKKINNIYMERLSFY